jgi:hypothetical protein
MMTPLPMILFACSSLLENALMLKFVRWDDEEAITDEHLRMRDGDIILDAIRLYACSKSRMAGWILVTLVVDVMPFEPTQKSQLLFFCIW